MGTAHVLEASRRCTSVRAVVCVATDKCYENREWMWGYRETDRLGGKDPYSASKAAAEIVASAYGQTLLPLEGDRIALATARAGNVIGGGDWSEDRLVPDILRSIETEKPIVLRNPTAVRPWQHVLDPLYGYVTLARRLLDQAPAAKGAWNFGPDSSNEVTVREMASRFTREYGCPEVPVEVVPSKLIESNLLRLDTSKSRIMLGWRPRLDFDQTVSMTAQWYRGFREGRPAAEMVDEQIAAFREMAS